MTVCFNAVCIVLNKQNRNMVRHWFKVDGLSMHGTFLMWKITKMRKICPFSFSQKFCITPFINSLLQNVTVGFGVYSQPNFVMVWCFTYTVGHPKRFFGKKLIVTCSAHSKEHFKTNLAEYVGGGGVKLPPGLHLDNNNPLNFNQRPYI